MNLEMADGLIKERISKLDNRGVTALSEFINAFYEESHSHADVNKFLNDILVFLTIDQSDINDIFLAKCQEHLYNSVHKLLIAGN
jgi:siroheme synthase (precorrin-2 oxidase/ferrochelatase)